VPRIEIDGYPPTPDELAAAALDDYGHFTAMQVRNLGVRGLDLHLRRLTSAHAELFGTSLDADLVRTRIGQALGSGSPDASVRVYVRQIEDRPTIMVTVREPGEMAGGGQPWRLQSVPYQRPAAHIKRFSDFGQAYFQRRAAQNGFDEALLTGAGGLVSEGSVTNVGFLAGSRITWPSAPMLAGITMQLIDAKFGAAGLDPARQPIRLSDLGEYNGAFVCNARGIALVGQIDDVTLPADERWITMITKVYESVEWDRI
jgi:branched-subunit amino acid aminotransferase/4-amino-4-deoxychorismate lyase